MSVPRAGPTDRPATRFAIVFTGMILMRFGV
jgi:hypothetical protein